jgi:hypothetical protein
MLTMVRHRRVATDEQRRLTMIRKNVANDMQDRQPVLGNTDGHDIIANGCKEM